MTRILFILALLLAVAVPVSAQDPQTSENLMPLTEVTGDLHGYLRLHTPDALHLFVRQTLAEYLEQEKRLSDAGMAAAQRAMFQRIFAEGIAIGGAMEEAPIIGDTSTGPPPGAIGYRAPGSARDTVTYLPLPRAIDTTKKNIVPGIIAQYADLGVAINGTGQMGGQWSQFKPCDVAVSLQCKAGIFPQLRPDMTFGVQVAGTVSQRVHVNVNFDQKNEFDAANNLNVSYKGLPDEVLQSIDVGDVSITLPQSRYMTRGIPAGNFGLRATGQLGPMDFQTVFAQQKGDLAKRKFTISGGGSQQSVVQQQHIVTDDADYVQGQFFYLVDPATITGSPYFDALALRAQDAPDAVRPRAGGIIAIYRDERIGTTSGGNSELGRFLADAAPNGPGLKHSGTFRRLTPDVDYVVHSSGLWITLKSPLRQDEALAMSYVTQTGDTVGDMNAEQAPPGVTPQLRLLRGPVSEHQPGAPTWTYEMHNVYRLDSSAGVDLTSIDMRISLGDIEGGKTFQNVNASQVPYLKFFGMDEDAPADKIDDAQIYQPSRGAFGTSANAIPGTFVVFPALQPFLDPAAVRSLNLSTADLKAALSTNANNAIYNEVDPVNRAAAARFKLNFDYRVKADGVASSFNLGAFGIRDGSEHITLGSQTLQRGVDYEIDYDVGQLTLKDAATLFATHPGAELNATWEQKPLFQIAPTTVFGLNGTYNLGQRGKIDLVGMYQAEKSLMSRPQLGTEPGSIFLGGLSGGLDLGGALLDRVFGKLPGMRLGGPSHAHLTGEVALSSPNPNTSGDAYLEDFEETDQLRIDPRRQNWMLGSRPETNTGDEGALPFTTNVSNAANLIWSHDYKTDAGTVAGAFHPSIDVDHSIIVVGNEPPDYGMFMTFGGGRPPAGSKQWRSITTVLSPTGMDLSHSEYLEFYAQSGVLDPISLVFDIGTVSEDAFYVDSAGHTNGFYPDSVIGEQKAWGLGVLDEEASLAKREVWGTGTGSFDARGLWNQDCVTTPTDVFALSDARLDCTRGNGVHNTEDLDGNGVLSANDGAYFRYVVSLDQLSKYVVRTREETGTGYQLYRIPLRDGVPVNGANDATWRFIKQMRLTVTGSPAQPRLIQLARINIIGSRWTKRDVSGTNSGLLSDKPGTVAADVHVSPVSKLVDPTYVIPAVNTSVQNAQDVLGASGVETNEKSLRITYDGLAPANRAEVYYRYAQQARSFMNYRALHLWALPKAGTWGVPNGERLVVKVGTDARNYYLFQTTLHPAGPVSVQSWLPELDIEFDKWFALKDSSEKYLIDHPPAAGGQDTLWSADSAYAIVLEDRARAPNLQSVRELSFAVYNAGNMETTGEVWIDDMRLTGATRTTGRAGAINLNVNAGDFLTGSLSFAHQDDVFQQLNENASYVAAGDLNFNVDAHLDRLLPARLGIDLPVSVTHSTTGQDPTFLQNTDVLATGLGALRATGSNATRIGVRLSKRTPTANPFMSILVDGTSLRFGYSTASTNAITSRAEAGSVDAGLSYSHGVAGKSFDVVPSFIEHGLRLLVPIQIENSDPFKRLVNSHLRYTPSSVSFNTGYAGQNARTFNYDRILATPEDSAIHAIESPRQGLQSDASVVFSLFNSLTANIGMTSNRDLLAAERATKDPVVRAALARARSRFGGIDMGWETSRGLNTGIDYTPVITNWLSVNYSYNNRYDTNRNPSYLTGTDPTDTTADMQRAFESGRSTARRIQFRPGDFAIALFGAAPKQPKGFDKWKRSVLRRFETLEFSWSNGLSSQFERESVLPGLGYQIGLGDFSSFQLIGTDSAARTQQTDEFHTTAGFALSKFVRADFSFGSTNLHGLDLRGGERMQNERDWPRVQMSVRNLPLPESWKKFLINASFGAGVDRVTTTDIFGGEGLQDRSTGRLDIPLSSTLTFPHAITLTYSGRISTGDNNDPTGRRETNNGMQSFRVTSIFGKPTMLSSKFNQPLTTSLTFTQQTTNQCASSLFGLAVPGTVIACTTQIQTTTRSGRFEAATGVDQMRIILSLDYNGRQNYVGTQTGSSQFLLSLSGNFAINAGTMPQFGGGR